jgi:Xaa-Pro aminopeptidase
LLSITAQKLNQAHQILNELDLDAWMLFVRESAEAGDPALALLYDGSFTWQTALIVTGSGDRIAIVGSLDADAIRATGEWTEVIPYVRGIQEPLREAIGRLAPRSLALNYSTDDYASDGLSHGMYQLLTGYLADTPQLQRLMSAEGVVAALRGRKSEAELARIKAAIDTAQSILEQVGLFAAPGKTEREIADFILAEAARRGVQPAWQPPCPIVNTGPASMVGHGVPSDLSIQPGHILHIDFGVQQNGYCSDLQRCWYVPRDGENEPPAAVRAAFDTVVRAISVAGDALRPGVLGWEVDRLAREIVTGAGYPDYGHALGHHVGRSAHDGGGILGPRWPRYVNSPYRQAEAGNVLTLEPSIPQVDGAGCLGLEEMVHVTPHGCQWLSQRQVSLPCLGR